MSTKPAVTSGKICADCPLRERCTTAKASRSMTTHPHEDLLRAARAQARTPQFTQAYPHPLEHRADHRLDRHPTPATHHAALPRRRQKPRLATHPLRRAQPAYPHQTRPHPPGRSLGPDLTSHDTPTTPCRHPYHPTQTGIGGKNDHAIDPTGLT